MLLPVTAATSIFRPRSRSDASARRVALLDAPELVRVVGGGVPFADAERLIRRSKLDADVVVTHVVRSAANLRRRRDAGRLTPEESDRLVRLARLWSAALGLHDGDGDAARRWLRSPRPALDGRSPLDYAVTEVGAREVEDLIGRLEHGVFS